MKANPWLFRRLVGLGILPPTMPIYVLSEAAAAEVSLLNGRVDQKRLAKVSIFPHDAFAMEMTVPSDDEDGVFFRTVTAVMKANLIPGIDAENLAALRHQDLNYALCEFQGIAGKIVWLPPMWLSEPGLYAGIVNIEGADMLRAQTVAQYKAAQRGVNRQDKHIAKLHFIDPQLLGSDEFVEDYNKKAGEACSFLTTACAVMAAPAAVLESGSVMTRAPSSKRGETGRVETKWTHVDIDLDRVTAKHSADETMSRSGVALHPVRAHLRMTRWGIAPVRAHMRGDARFGVRHRVGSVNRAGE